MFLGALNMFGSRVLGRQLLGLAAQIDILSPFIDNWQAMISPAIFPPGGRSICALDTGIEDLLTVTVDVLKSKCSSLGVGVQGRPVVSSHGPLLRALISLDSIGRRAADVTKDIAYWR
jgi:hypothetical protein